MEWDQEEWTCCDLKTDSWKVDRDPEITAVAAKRLRVAHTERCTHLKCQGPASAELTASDRYAASEGIDSHGVWAIRQKYLAIRR